MKYAIIGAGAIGGMVGAKLALAGEDVTFIARGENLRAIREHGLRYAEGGAPMQTIREHVSATSDYAAAGPQDVVVVAVKAHQVADVAAQIPALLGPETPIVTMQNGIPFWYFHKHGGPLEGMQVKTVDAGAPLVQHLPVDRLIGSVVYPAAELVAPGVIQHVEGHRFALGELDGRITPRLERIAQSFERAGLKAPLLDNVRAEIWLKLWGNLCFNPISALAHATLVDICQFPLSRELAAGMMREAQAVAEKLGIHMRVPLEKRIAGAEKVGAHKTSMLQDVESGRAPEIDALLGSVIELGRMVSVPTPQMDAVYALVKLLAKGMAHSGGSVRLTARAN